MGKAANIFINYRRGADVWPAGRLHERLVAAFGKTHSFMDITGVAPGEDFKSVIRSEIEKCDIMLALMGKNWLTNKSAANSGLEDPNDFVRIELETGLELRRKIIPILLDGAKMPGETDLVSSLKPLASCNAFSIRAESFGGDISRLISFLQHGGDITDKLTNDSLRLLQSLVEQSIQKNALQRAHTKILNAKVQRSYIDGDVWRIGGTFNGAIHIPIYGEYKYWGWFRGCTNSIGDLRLWELEFTSFWEWIRLQVWVPVKSDLIAQANQEAFNA